MNLLEELQNAAVDDSSDLGTLLRKCKILAARLGSQQLEDWLIREANGYPKNVPVPEYRVWPLQVKGNFAGPSSSSISTLSIPLKSLPKDVRKSYNNYEFRESIASVEHLLEENKTCIICVLTQNLALTLGTKVLTQMNCLECWTEFSTLHFVELLNTVRNRLLDFLVAVQKEHPNADMTNSNVPDSPSPDKITQIFNMTVTDGGNVNIVGTANDSSVGSAIISNNFESVRRVLKENGMSEQDLEELKNALDEDGLPQSLGSFGPKVSSWIASMRKKAAEGTWNIGIGTAANLLSEILSKFYNF